MAKFPQRIIIAAASSLLLLGIAPAFAGDDTVRAEAYFGSIAGGDPEIITSFYADDAEFRWIGGPLAGVYKGRDKIKGVWTRFSEAAGNFTHEVLELSETAKGKDSVITARVAFKGATEVPVKFVITYKDGKIASETWQVDKSPNAAAKAEPKPEPKPAPGEKPVTATVVTVEPSAAPTIPPRKPAADEQPDYLPRGAMTSAPSAPSATKQGAPAEAKPAPKAKTADKRKKRDYYENDGDYRYGYGPRRYYRDYDDDDYGPGHRSYGRYRGYGGLWGGYGGYGY